MNRRPESRTAAPAARTNRIRAEVPMKHSSRTLTPKTVFRGLDRELELLASAFAELSPPHIAMAPYPTLASLIARLTTGPRDDAKKELLAAIIAIRQSTPHRLWVAILLRAFRPMLAKVWKKLFGSDTEERLALLLLSFQAAIRHVDPTRDPLRIGMYVRQETRRRAIVALSKELSWGEVGFGEDADECPDPRHDHTPDETAARRRAVVALLRGSALRGHVRRAHPTLSSDEQTREYERLRRRLRRRLRTSRDGSGDQAVAS
jgi:hypothetical protein